MTLLKNKGVLIVSTLLMSAAFSTAVFASNVGTVTRDSINIRSGDSTDSQVIGVTNTGDQYAILDVEPGWVKISYPNSGEAYIASLYVKVSEADASVTDHAVNVRTAPTTASDVIGQANVGETVTVTGKTEDGAWYKVSYNGQDAYISADYLGGSYLYLVQADKQTETKQAETKTAENVINQVIGEMGGAAVEAEAAVEAPKLTAEDILLTFQPAEKNTYAIINSPGGLRLRSTPSTDSSNTIISVLSDGYAVTVLESGEGWLHVSDDYGNEGYISSEYVELYVGEKPENTGHTDFNKDALTGDAAEIAEYALDFIGTPYVYGGTDLTSGVDCSGFVYSVYQHFGITLQRNSASMYSQGTYVSKDELQAGDLVFFNTGGNTNISHVGMYLGDDMYIHSSTYSTGVIVEDLYDDYSTSTYVGAKRIIN
ncbi:MAG: SH3 domain-containing protein [Clostridiales bacterium]|nr:SH3 domain-containing protein [Clostridiales bacterium]